MRRDIITINLIIEAKTEADLQIIIEDVYRNLKKGWTTESYYVGGGYVSLKKIGNSDTEYRNILFRNFG